MVGLAPTFDPLNEKIKQNLDNIENMMIRNEQKVSINKNYFLPRVTMSMCVSLCLHLRVHFFSKPLIGPQIT